MKRNILFIGFLLMLDSCYVGRALVWNVADIHDYKKFASRKIAKSSAPFSFKEPNSESSNYIKDTATFQAMLNKTKTVAFMVIRNDSILYEYYPSKYGVSSTVPSFSVAKSFVSALAGIAVDEGYIKNVTDPITNYLPYLDKETFGKITVENLVDMRSGIKCRESYLNPFGNVAKYYYGLNLQKYLTKLKVQEAPDQRFIYLSVNTQLLAAVIEKATGKTLDVYFREKIWEPLGMESK